MTSSYNDDPEPSSWSRRSKIVTWTVIIALVLGGGGATVLALLLS